MADSGASSRWKIVRWLMVGVAVLCGGTLLLMNLSASLEKGVAWWAPWLLLIVMVGTISATLISSSFQIRGRKFTDLAQDPQNIATTILALAAAFGIATDVSSLFSPRAAIEPEPGAIFDTVSSTSKDISGLRKEVRAGFGLSGSKEVEKRIVGRWGEQEPPCGLVWQIDIQDHSFSAKIVKRPAGVEEFELVARIIPSGKPGIIDIVGESPSSARGSAAQLRYSFDGGTERLVWDDLRRSTDMQEYQRC